MGWDGMGWDGIDGIGRDGMGWDWVEEGRVFGDGEFSRSPPFTLLFPLGCDVPFTRLTRFKRPERGESGP